MVDVFSKVFCRDRWAFSSRLINFCRVRFVAGFPSKGISPRPHFCRFSIRPSISSLFLTGLFSLFSGYKLGFQALTSYTYIKLVFFAVLVVFRWLETQFPASLELYAKIALFLNTRGINWSASAVKEVGLNWFTQSLEPNASSFRNNLLHTSLTSII